MRQNAAAANRATKTPALMLAVAGHADGSLGLWELERGRRLDETKPGSGLGLSP